MTTPLRDPNTVPAAIVPRHAEKLAALAAAQGVKPVSSLDDLGGDFWPVAESADEFNETVRRWREQDSREREN